MSTVLTRRPARSSGHTPGALSRVAGTKANRCPYCGEDNCTHVILHCRSRDAIPRLYMWSEFGINTVHAAPGPRLAAEILNTLGTHCAIQRNAVYGTEWGREYARRQVLVYLRELGLEVDSGET